MICKYTNGIPTCPVCPVCQRPTRRVLGISTTTCVYYEPIYDEQGNNINLDRNNNRTEYCCLDCGKTFTVVGNPHDGYHYC